MTENGAILSIPGATVLPDRKGMERVLCNHAHSSPLPGSDFGLGHSPALLSPLLKKGFKPGD